MWHLSGTLSATSSLLSCSLLNKSGYGYKISHLFYMDDLKTYAKNDDEQTGLLRTIK